MKSSAGPTEFSLRDMIAPANPKKQITESVAYACQPKQYALDADSCSKETRALHIEIYKRACADFTRCSAEAAAALNAAQFDKMLSASAGAGAARSSVTLHELFFSNCFCRNSELSVSSIAYARFARDFGEFDDWQRDFVSRASKMRGQSGWIITALDMFLRKFVNFTVVGDAAPISAWPIIVVDCHEHAYVRDYSSDVQKYVQQMMAELNWDVVNERVTRADAILEALR